MISDPSVGEGDPIPSNSTPDVAAGEITELLGAWNRGDQLAEAKLFGLVYPQLHRIAARGLARLPSSAGFETTDLVHDAYLRLVNQRKGWRNGDHFFATVATLVRRIVGDHAKHRQRQKRGAGAAHASLDDVELAGPSPDLDGLALNQVLGELSSIDRTAARVVALRYFEGLSLDEVAEVLEVGRATVVRSWGFARCFLGRRLRKEACRL